jgi:hypothetical protein
MDIVSFEIAQKLKEKGFREKTSGGYMLPIKLPHFPLTYSLKDWNKADDCYSAPTISQVLKWLREEKKIYVLININFDMTWFWDILGINTEPDCFGESDGTYQSYKQAALAGIKYCLDNLI